MSLAPRLVAAALVLLATPLFAQEPTPPGDKSAGEEEQIARREEWLLTSRSALAAARPPGELRASAIAEVRAARARAPQALPSWHGLGPDSATMLNWVMGKVSGRIAALAIDPTDENVVYLGAASGGLWKTTDGGASWTSLFDGVGTESIGSIVLQPGNPNVVWAGTGEQGQSCSGYFGLGLFRSTDGGATWQPRNGAGATALNLSYVSGIVVNASNPQIVLAGGHGWCSAGTLVAGSVYRSTDGGDTWQQVLAGPASDLIADPGNANVVYAAIGRYSYATDGVYKSTDAGATWTRLENGIAFGATVKRMRLAMAPSNAQTLYAMVNQTDNATHLYKTTNGGTSWSQVNASVCEGQCSYNLCLAVHPTTPETLLLGSIRFARSIDSGTSYSWLTSGWGSGQKVHQDTHVLLYSKTNGQRFWVGSDGGLWRTDDGGTTFTNLNANLNVTQFYDIALPVGTPGVVFGGAQDNSSIGRFEQQLWDVTIVSGDGFVNLVDPLSGQRVFQTSYPSSSLPMIARSESGGAPNTFSWLSRTGIATGPFPWVTPLAIAEEPHSGYSQVFVGSNAVYRGRADQPSAGGFTWSSISGDLTGGSGSINVLTAVPLGLTAHLWAGTASGKIQRTVDPFASTPTWSNVTGDYPGGSVSDVAVDATNPERAFITRGAFGGVKLYRTTNGGTTWTPVGAGLPDVPANSVAIDPTDPSVVYVGTDVGVFLSTDHGETVVPLADGMPLGAVVTDLEIDGATRRLTAGTYGRGAWQLDLTDISGFSDGFEPGTTARWSTQYPL